MDAVAAEKLTPTDVRNVLLLLDVCTQRGAFKAQELSQVGAIYDRLSAALPNTAEEYRRGAPDTSVKGESTNTVI